MNVKSIFASKTFWLNVIGLASLFVPNLSPQYSMPILAVLNIANRFLTNGSVNIMGAEK